MLIIPEKINIQIKDEKGNNLEIENVLIEIRTKATSKNDIHLAPFKSNSNGFIAITKNDILKKTEEVYNNGLMDYDDIESATSEIEINIIKQGETLRRIEHFKTILNNSEENAKLLKDRVNKEDFQILVSEIKKNQKYLIEILKDYESSFNKSHYLDAAKFICDSWEKEDVKNYSFEINI